MEPFPYRFLQVSLLYLSCGLIHGLVKVDNFYDDYYEVVAVVKKHVANPQESVENPRDEKTEFYPEEGDLFFLDSLRAGFDKVKSALPIVWTQYVNTNGSVGIEARCMLMPKSTQPDGSFFPGSTVSQRVKGREGVLDANGDVQKGFKGQTAADPYFWPLDIWVAKIPAGVNITGASFCNRTLPNITGSPVKIGALGDTGLRVKTTNDGKCKKSMNTDLFGVKALCQPSDRETSKPAGEFQGLSAWPVASVSSEMAKNPLDLVLHMGDFVYRQWLCPWSKECNGINKHAAWGDTVVSWYYELFQPFESLLAAAPWVMSRGNHEICSRAGTGWTLMLGPDDLLPDHHWDNVGVVASSNCNGKAHKAFTIPFENKLEIGFFDTSGLMEVTQQNKASIDSYPFKLAKKAVPTKDEMSKGVIQIPLTGPKANYNGVKEDDDGEPCRGTPSRQEYRFRKAIKKLANTSNKDSFVMMLTHVPVHALVADGANESNMVFIGYNANVRKALYDVPSYKPQITFGGHMHWFQRWQSQSTTQFVLGNGGTMLIPEAGVPDHKNLSLGFQGENGTVVNTFEGKVVAEFGFSLLDFNSTAGQMKARHYKVNKNESGIWERDPTPLDECIIPPASSRR